MTDGSRHVGFNSSRVRHSTRLRPACRRAGVSGTHRLQLIEVTARLHPFVQNAHDLYDALVVDAVVENMNGVPHLDDFSRHSGMSDMEAEDTRSEALAASSRADREAQPRLAVSRPRDGRVTLGAVDAPSLSAGGKDVGEINCAGRARRNRAIQPSARVWQRASAPARVPFEISVVTSTKSPRSSTSTPALICARSAFSRRLSSLRRCCSARSASRIASLAFWLLAGLDYLLDKGILLGRQADVARWHSDLAAFT